MTTSQASRIYGIPYNSLLMYVRGKYGKSLKLDRLKQTTPAANDNLNTIGNSRSTPKEKIHAQQQLEQQQMSENKRVRKSSTSSGPDTQAMDVPSMAFGPGSGGSPGFSSGHHTVTSQTPTSSGSGTASPMFNPYSASPFFTQGQQNLQGQIGLLRMMPGHAAVAASSNPAGLSPDVARMREFMLSMQRQRESSLNQEPTHEDKNEDEEEPQNDELIIDEDDNDPPPSEIVTPNAAAASFLALAAHAVNAASSAQNNGSVGSSRSPGSLGESNDETEDIAKRAEEKERGGSFLALDAREKVSGREEVNNLDVAKEIPTI